MDSGLNDCKANVLPTEQSPLPCVVTKDGWLTPPLGTACSSPSAAAPPPLLPIVHSLLLPFSWSVLVDKISPYTHFAGPVSVFCSNLSGREEFEVQERSWHLLLQTVMDKPHSPLCSFTPVEVAVNWFPACTREILCKNPLSVVVSY